MAKRKNKKHFKAPKHRNRSLNKVAKEDIFLDENSKVIVEDAFVGQPSVDEVQEVLTGLDGFRDWQREDHGQGLTFGDY